MEEEREEQHPPRARLPTVSIESNPPRLAQHNSCGLFGAVESKTPTTTASHEFIMLMMCGAVVVDSGVQPTTVLPQNKLHNNTPEEYRYNMRPQE